MAKLKGSKLKGSKLKMRGGGDFLDTAVKLAGAFVLCAFLLFIFFGPTS